MADLQTMMRAFQNAKAAGDTAAASRLAKQIKQLQSQQAAPQQAPAQPDTSFTSALQFGLDQPLENTAVTAKALGYEGAGQVLSDLTEAPENYQSAMQGLLNPKEGDMTIGGFGIGYLPRAAVEQVGQFAGSLASRAAGAAAGGFVGGPIGAVGGAIAAPAIFEAVQVLGPAALESAKNNGRTEPAWEDWQRAAAVAGVSGALNAVGANSTGILNRTLKEGATEAAQSTTEQVGTSAGTKAGLQYDPRQAIAEGLTGGTAAGGITTATTAASKVADAVTGSSPQQRAADAATAVGDVLNPVMIGHDTEAATGLARKLEGIAEANNLDLQKVSKNGQTGAREAIHIAHGQYAAELRRLRRDLKDRLSPDVSDQFDVIMDKVLADAGTVQARNLAKSIVGMQEMRAVDRLVGDTREGQQLLRLMREMNELTTLHNSGYVGGLSQYTDQLSPIPSNVGYSDRSLIEIPTRLMGTLYGASVNPLIPAVQGTAVLTGRAVDAVTGRRSRVAKYIRDNRNNSEGIDISGAPSLVEGQRREAAELKRRAQQDAERATEIHKSIYEQNGRFAPVLPQQQILDELGLSPQRAVELLDQIAENPTYRQDAQAMIKSIMEGGRIPNMSAIAGVMRTYMDQNAVQRDRTPVQPQQQAQSSTPTETAGYLRGIQDNREANNALVELVNNDPNIAPVDKVTLISALADLRSNLGANPADRAMDIAGEAEAKLQDSALADTYLMPYVNRVIRQQPDDSIETNFMAVPEIGEGLSIFPKTKALYNKIDGIEVDQGNYQAGPNDVTGNSYAGARVYIKENGRGALEVDPEQSAAPNKADGRRWVSNLVRPNLYEWTNNPDNMPQSFIVTVEQGPTHHYALQYEADVPTELYRKPLRADGSKQDEPTMRPRGFGELQFGRQIGEIKIKSSGRTVPIYDTIRIVPKEQPVLNMVDEGDAFNTADGDQLSTVFDPDAKTEMGFLPYLRTAYNKKYDHPRKILASVNRKNADKQLAALDQLLIDHPNTLSSPEAFMDYLSDAMGKANKDGSVPVIPYRALEMVQNPQIIIDQLAGMTQGQLDLAADGFSAADDFRAAYLDGSAQPDITGKLLLWGILSRGVSPYIQEALFLDVVTERGNQHGIGKFINDAAAGKFNEAEYKSWVKRVVPSNSAGAGSTHNLNAFGETLLRKMSIPMDDGVTPMQRLHDLMASDMSGKEVRREFHRINDKVGINNKVLSFMLLVSGRNDVMVLDRIQFRNMFDDGRFGDFNIYDPSVVGKKQIAGSSIQGLGDDTMGLMIYEALERDLAPTVKAAYEALGRGADFSMGRYHWESWVASSAQEVDHGTITGIINEALGMPNPYDAINTREGRYDRFDSGAVYGYNPQTGMPFVRLPDGLGNLYEFTPSKAKDVLQRIRAAKKADGIINDKGFKVSESRKGPWYDRPEVNKEKLRQVFIEEGGRILGEGVLQADEGNTDGSGDSISYNSDGEAFNNFERSNIRAGSRPVEPQEVRTQYDITKEILKDGVIQIGLEGTPFENGIGDPRVAGLIAEAMGYAFEMYKNPTQMNRDAKERYNPSGLSSGGFTLGFHLGKVSPYDDITDRKTGKSYKGKIHALMPYTHPRGNKDKNISLAQSLFVALHELGHAIERMPFNGKTGEPSYRNTNNPLYGTVSPSTKSIYSNTFRDQIAQLLEKTAGAMGQGPASRNDVDTTETGVSDARAQNILAEMIEWQRKGILSSPDGSQEFVRREYMLKDKAIAEGRVSEGQANGIMQKREITYYHTPEELAADMIGSYLMDPKGFKAACPKSAEFVRQVLNGAASPTSNIVKFYSAPFAAVLAVIMAQLVLGDEEEEEAQAALSLGRGALSA